MRRAYRYRQLPQSTHAPGGGLDAAIAYLEASVEDESLQGRDEVWRVVVIFHHHRADGVRARAVAVAVLALQRRLGSGSAGSRRVAALQPPHHDGGVADRVREALQYALAAAPREGPQVLVTKVQAVREVHRRQRGAAGRDVRKPNP